MWKLTLGYGSWILMGTNGKKIKKCGVLIWSTNTQ